VSVVATRARRAWRSPGARRFKCGLVLLALALRPATAADWGLITPGGTTMEGVRARYGQPTRIEAKKVDAYDTVQWIYEGAQAPVGMSRMTVDFGLLTAAGYKNDVVRDFRLDTKPGSFNKRLVLDGWGDPYKVGKDGDFEIFLYEDGLLVYFDKTGWDVQTMVFTVPQPTSASGAKPTPPRPQR
jgi:hypothetical protein